MAEIRIENAVKTFGKVVAVDDEAPKGRFPKVTGRVGESPPQYLSDEDWDEED